jgi:maltose alpha-D-glucosyltransferase/alpha-amylase
MLGDTVFPTIRKAPYFLSLGPHGFYWFRLDRPGDGDEPYGIEATPI